MLLAMIRAVVLLCVAVYGCCGLWLWIVVVDCGCVLFVVCSCACRVQLCLSCAVVLTNDLLTLCTFVFISRYPHV